MFSNRAAALPAFVFFVLLGSSTVSWAQDAADKEPVSEAAVRADLHFLYNALAAAHFDLFANKTKQAYDAFFQEIESSIIGAMSRLEVMRLLMPFVAFGDIGHARIDFPIPAYVEYLQQGGTLIPIDIEVVQGQIQIAHAYADDETLVPGMVLVAINGEPAAQWVARVSRYVSAERSYMVHAQLENMFPRLVWLVAGKTDRFELTVRNSSGELQSVTVDAVPVMDVEQHKGQIEAEYHSREAEMLDASIAYLRPGPFYAVTEDESAETFTQFLDHAFAEFLKADAKDLIVDLRNNPGGDNSYSDPMIAWFADQPFHFASRFTVKASDQTRDGPGKPGQSRPGWDFCADAAGDAVGRKWRTL